MLVNEINEDTFTYLLATLNNINFFVISILRMSNVRFDISFGRCTHQANLVRSNCFE